MGLFGPIKPLHRAEEDGKALAKTLSWPLLMPLGIGGIIGTGIYTLTGVGMGLVAKVNKKGSPALITLITGIFVAIFAGFVPLKEIAALSDAGTLIAFVAVALR